LSAAPALASGANDAHAAVLDVRAAKAYDSGDSALAADLWRCAAEAGGRDAMTSLGALLEEGDGVHADAALARLWYVRAAEQGEPHAMVLLAIERLNNDPADQKGIALMTRAAALDHDFAKRHLAALSGDAGGHSDDSIGDHQ
jgi:TPR repeat protein